MFVPLSNLNFTSGLMVVDPFDESRNAAKIMTKKKSRKDRSLFISALCCMPGCIATFVTKEVMQTHVDEGEHIFS